MRIIDMLPESVIILYFSAHHLSLISCHIISEAGQSLCVISSMRATQWFCRCIRVLEPQYFTLAPSIDLQFKPTLQSGFQSNLQELKPFPQRQINFSALATASSTIMTTQNKRVADLTTDQPHPECEATVVNTTRCQRARAANGAVQADEPAAPAQDTAALTSNIETTSNEKPKEKGWEASLTMAQLKAYKAEEALKAHNKRFPPKPKADPKTAKPNQAPVKDKETANTNKTHAGLKNTKTTNSVNARWANVARNESNNFKAVLVVPQAPCSGCGIKDCPVKDKHERRVYAVKDPNRPNLIKKIQAKFGASEKEMRTLTHFFEAHKKDAELQKRGGEMQKHDGQ